MTALVRKVKYATTLGCRCSDCSSDMKFSPDIPHSPERDIANGTIVIQVTDLQVFSDAEDDDDTWALVLCQGRLGWFYMKELTDL